MNLKHLLASPKAAELLKANPRYRHENTVAGFELYENLSVLPRYFFASSVRRAADREMEELIRSRAVDLHHTALIEEPVPLTPSDAAAAGTVRTLRYEPGQLELEVTTPEPSFLVLSEAYYPGWAAWIDDQPGNIYRTDVAFRGMAVPAGTHRVRMQFQPRIFDLSRAVTALTLILVAGLAWWPRSR
jgi:hypothetical protein